MKLYARRMEGIDRDRWNVFMNMCADVDVLPDIDPPEAVSCHVLCHTLSLRHGVDAVHGWYGGRMNWHSWIDLGKGIIADMYPIAAGRPQILDTNGMLNPVSRLYVEVPDALLHIRVDPEPLARRLVDHLNGGKQL